MNDRTRGAVSFAALIVGIVAPLTYVGLRMFERMSNGVADPSAIVAEAHAPAFFWRAAIATWWAVLCGAMTFALARRSSNLERVTTVAGWLACPMAAVVLLLAWLFP